MIVYVTNKIFASDRNFDSFSICFFAQLFAESTLICINRLCVILIERGKALIEVFQRKVQWADRFTLGCVRSRRRKVIGDPSARSAVDRRIDLIVGVISGVLMIRHEKRETLKIKTEARRLFAVRIRWWKENEFDQILLHHEKIHFPAQRSQMRQKHVEDVDAFLFFSSLRKISEEEEIY